MGWGVAWRVGGVGREGRESIFREASMALMVQAASFRPPSSLPALRPPISHTDLVTYVLAVIDFHFHLLSYHTTCST